MTTLARLSFWIDPVRQKEFAALYEQKLVPLLQKHDLIESPEPGRRTVEGVFSRLFEMACSIQEVLDYLASLNPRGKLSTIRVDGEGYIYVADVFNQRIQKFAP